MVPLPGWVMMGDSNASAMRLMYSRERFCVPDSTRWIALWEVFRISANWFCVIPCCLRASRIRRPTEAGVMLSTADPFDDNSFPDQDISDLSSSPREERVEQASRDLFSEIFVTDRCSH